MRKIDSLLGALYLVTSLPLAAFSISWIQANTAVGLFRGPGDLAASGIPMVLLLVAGAAFQAFIGARLWVAAIIAITAVVSLALTWIAHLGGPIYEAAGAVHSALVVICIAAMLWKWRSGKTGPSGASPSSV